MHVFSRNTAKAAECSAALHSENQKIDSTKSSFVLGKRATPEGAALNFSSFHAQSVEALSGDLCLSANKFSEMHFPMLKVN